MISGYQNRVDIVLVDGDDKVLGLKEKYEAHHNPVALHRAVSVVIYDKNHKKILLQKRSSNKPTWPGCWSNTCCTHPLPEESYQDAAERRIWQEMGIKTPLKEAFSFIYKAKYDETWGEHELDHIFVGEYSGKVKPDPNEAEDFKWMKIDDLKKDIEENPNIYSPWFKIILARLH